MFYFSMDPKFLLLAYLENNFRPRHRNSLLFLYVKRIEKEILEHAIVVLESMSCKSPLVRLTMPRSFFSQVLQKLCSN